MSKPHSRARTPAPAAPQPAGPTQGARAKTDPLEATAAEAVPTTALPAKAPRGSGQTKLDRLVKLLRRPQGATLAEMQAVTGWQAHSVRGALAGAIKTRLALAVSSEKEERGRVYRIGSPVQS